MRLKLFLIVFLTVCVTGCLAVRLPGIQIKKGTLETRLTWKDVVQQTLRANPDLASARFSVTSSARSRDQAIGNYLPSVTGSFERDRTRTTATTPTGDNMQIGIAGDQPLFTGFDNAGKLLKAKKDLQVSKLSYQEISASTRFQLRSVYVELLKLEKLLGVDQRIAERRKHNAELIRLRYDGGRENLGSALRAEAIRDRAFFGVRAILRRMNSQSLLLCRQIGADFVTPVYVEGDLEDIIPQNLDSEPDYAELATKTPTVHKLIRTAESYKAVLVSAQAALWPKVDGLFDYGYSGDRLTRMRDDFLLGLRVSVPLFSGGQNVEGILKARADYLAAVERAKSAQIDTIAKLADAWVQMKDAVEAVEVQKSFVVSSRKRAEIVRSEYETGLVNYQDFDIAEQDLADAENTYVQSLADVLTKEANWEFIKGSTLEDALNES